MRTLELALNLGIYAAIGLGILALFVVILAFAAYAVGLVGDKEEDKR